MAPLPRISLAEVARTTGTVLSSAGSDRWSADSQPTLADISECLYFSPGDGRIWLNDQRMLLLHSRAMGTLRRELIDSLGIDRARGLLTRAGYVSGAHDARLVRERWPDAEPSAILIAGTRLHTLEGMVKVVRSASATHRRTAATRASSCGTTRARTTSTWTPTASAPRRPAGCSSAMRSATSARCSGTW